MLIKRSEAGVVFDIVHRGAPIDVSYASVTAPELVYVEVAVDAVVVDGVWVGPGSSHSWWTYAGGKLLPNGLIDGQRLVVTTTGPCAFRCDFTE